MSPPTVPSDLHRRLYFKRFGKPEQAISVEPHERSPLGDDEILTRMALSPINPSDVIPITGAYKHRTASYGVPGYEGVGRVIAAGKDYAHLIGSRVLPVRGEGTWQTHVRSPGKWAIPVDRELSDELACRAYINPVSAIAMLDRWRPQHRHVILTAAGSSIARILAAEALKKNAADVWAITDSGVHDRSLKAIGAIPIRPHDAIQRLPQLDGPLVFDAIGGAFATLLMSRLNKGSQLVSYGLLSGVPILGGAASCSHERFHLREQIQKWSPQEWKQMTSNAQRLLQRVSVPELRVFGFEAYKKALNFFYSRSRLEKPALSFSNQEGV